MPDALAAVTARTTRRADDPRVDRGSPIRRCRRGARNGWLVMAWSLSLSAFASSAAAYDVARCVGDTTRWAQPEIDLDLMPCSSPAGSNRAADFYAATDAWNAVAGSAARFDVSVGSRACSARINGVSELGYADSRYLDGARGMTRLIYTGACRPAESRDEEPVRRVIVEADVLVSAKRSMLSGLPPDCTTAYVNTRQGTALHELGHVLGLGHDDSQVAHMNTAAAPARYCGVRAYEPHPDDRAGARVLYPSGEPVPRDVGASPYKLDGPGNVVPVQDDEPIWACPGTLVPLNWSAANLGVDDVTTDVWFYVSNNDIISSHDHRVGGVNGVVVPAGQFITGEGTMRVPRYAPSGGPYYVGFRVDPRRETWELPASNDTTYTAARLFIYPPSQCD